MGVPEISPELITIVDDLYSDESTHGREHALDTERRARETSLEPEYFGVVSDRERLLVSIAALGHDLGYQEKRSHWTGWQWEHPYESVELLDQILKGTDLTKQERVMVGLLVLNHDNTSYAFPAFRRFEVERMGFPEPVGIPGLAPGTTSEAFGFGAHLEDLPYERFEKLLHILQEADASLGNAQRTIEFSRSRGIPITADDGGVPGVPGIGMPMWQYSGLANVLLAANRALLDSYTVSGQQRAWEMFVQTRDYIKSIIGAQPQTPPNYDNVGELLRYQDVVDHIWSSPPGDRYRQHVRITQAFALEGLSRIIPAEFLKGSRIRIASRLVNVDDIETKSGIEKDRVELLNYLRASLIKNYALDILTEMSGALRIFAMTKPYSYEREYTLISPILQARDKDDWEIYNPPYAATFGAHWIQLAKKLGLNQTRVLFIEGE